VGFDHRHRHQGRADRSGAGEDDLVEEALEFWSNNAEEYLDHPADFEYVRKAEGPNIIVEFVEPLTDCAEEHDEEEVAGCAPLNEDMSVPDGDTARIKTEYDREQLLRTIKHELGHILGLGREDEPRSIKVSDQRKLIDDYEAKVTIAETYTEAKERYNGAMETHNNGLVDWKHLDSALAEEKMREAAEDFRSAAADFDGERQRAAAIDKAEVAEMLDRATRRSALLGVACESLATGAAARERTDTETEVVDRNHENYESTYDEATAIEMPDGERLYALLGRN